MIVKKIEFPLNLLSFSPLSLLLLVCCFSCQTTKCSLDPAICYSPPQQYLERLPPAFPELTPAELAQEWGKEFHLGRSFARQMDLYRAITCFKRALFLMPSQQRERQLQIEYEVFLAYYFGNKYQEAVDIFETTRLAYATETFPAFHDLAIALYDAYLQLGEIEKAERLQCFISSFDNELAERLKLQTALLNADFPALEALPEQEVIDQFLCEYASKAKSVSKARMLNTILPGAGYYYVGQKNSALTSFVINALFITAAYQLFDRGYIAGGIILTSLESGWYFGGINGAGLAANEYNQVLYESLGKETLLQNRLFPILMIQKGF